MKKMWITIGYAIGDRLLNSCVCKSSSLTIEPIGSSDYESFT